MTPTAHAILSASKAERWLNCTPSARLEEKFPDGSSDAAREGTLAHALGELLIRINSGLVSPSDFHAALAEIEKSEFYNEAMYQHCDDYATYVIEQYNEAKAASADALISLEQCLNLSEWIPEGFGTSDCVIIADGVMWVIDLKYGKGVPVTATNNRQMMCYGVGALAEVDHLYAIHTVRLIIFQPRLGGASTWDITADDLKAWAADELTKRAALAFAGEGEFKVGPHCGFCKVKATCKALADYNLEIARHDFAEPHLLSDDDIADILNREKMFTNWIGAVTDYALAQALANGKKWPGWKLVEGRSVRVITNEEEAAKKLLAASFSEVDIYKPRTLLGITALEKITGKKTFEALLSPVIAKPPGKPTLAPVTDKRPEYQPAELLKAEFAED